MSKDLTSIIELDYDELVKTIDDYKDELFVYQAGRLYLVDSIDGDTVRTNSGAMSDISFLVGVYTTTHLLGKPHLTDDDGKAIDYIIMQYKNQGRVKAIYKDILWEGSYYGGFKAWLSKSITVVNDYMFNIIDEKVGEAIDGIQVDSSSVLALIDTYHMPVSRDLMLAKAIEKYSSEMSTLLEAIVNPGLKSGFKSIVNSMKELINPKPIKPATIPKVPAPKKEAPKKTGGRKTGTNK